MGNFFLIRFQYKVFWRSEFCRSDTGHRGGAERGPGQADILLCRTKHNLNPSNKKIWKFSDVELLEYYEEHGGGSGAQPGTQLHPSQAGEVTSHKNVHPFILFIVTSVVDPNTLNLDPDPEFLPSLNPDLGLCFQFSRKKFKNNFREQFSLKNLFSTIRKEWYRTRRTF